MRTDGVAEGFRPADGVLLFEDAATTSKIPALDQPALGKIAARAHPGDTLTVSELFWLCRDLLDTHAVRNWCHPPDDYQVSLSKPCHLGTSRPGRGVTSTRVVTRWKILMPPTRGTSASTLGELRERPQPQ